MLLAPPTPRSASPPPSRRCVCEARIGYRPVTQHPATQSAPAPPAQDPPPRASGLPRPSSDPSPSLRLARRPQTSAPYWPPAAPLRAGALPPPSGGGVGSRDVFAVPPPRLPGGARVAGRGGGTGPDPRRSTAPTALPTAPRAAASPRVPSPLCAARRRGGSSPGEAGSPPPGRQLKWRAA